jgi:hypothetical protein
MEGAFSLGALELRQRSDQQIVRHEHLWQRPLQELGVLLAASPPTKPSHNRRTR